MTAETGADEPYDADASRLRDRILEVLEPYTDPGDGTVPLWIGGRLPVWQSVDVLAEELMAVVRPVLDAKDTTHDELKRTALLLMDRKERAERTIHRVQTVRCWTNEDGKLFVFAEDLRAALGVATDRYAPHTTERT